MCPMIVCMLSSVEYLHSMICICLRPRYVGSLTSLPCELRVKQIARMRSGLWCLGLCCGLGPSQVWIVGNPDFLFCRLVSLPVLSVHYLGGVYVGGGGVLCQL